MKRDIDFIRAILLKVEEECPQRHVNFKNFEQLGEYDKDVFNEHVRLLVEDNIIEVLANTNESGYYDVAFIKRLTSKGHDFLDSIRDEKVYSITKERLSKITGWTLPIVREVATGVIKSMLNI